MDGGVLNIETVDGKTTEFRGNTARDRSDALHLKGNTLINFNSRDNSVVNMFDAITKEGSYATRNAVITINGNGQFNLSCREESIIPNLSINDRSVFNLGANTPLQISDNLRVAQDAVFNAGNGAVDIVLVGNYVQDGTLSMDIFADGNEGECSRSNQIIATGNVSLGENSRLHIMENGDCRKKAYMLIRYGSLEGRFGSLLTTSNHDIEYEYEGHWIVLLPKEEEPIGQREEQTVTSAVADGQAGSDLRGRVNLFTYFWEIRVRNIKFKSKRDGKDNRKVVNQSCETFRFGHSDENFKISCPK
jgi:hypothetical protein